MRKFILAALIAFLASAAWAAAPTVTSGTLTVARATFDANRYEVVTLTCTSDASSTDVQATGILLEGELVRVVTDPSATAPTDSYDIILSDALGADILCGLGANRDTANTEQFCPMIGNGTGVHGATSPGNLVPVVLSGNHTLAMTEMGESKIVTLVLYLRRL